MRNGVAKFVYNSSADQWSWIEQNMEELIAERTKLLEKFPLLKKIFNEFWFTTHVSAVMAKNTGAWCVAYDYFIVTEYRIFVYQFVSIASVARLLAHEMYEVALRNWFGYSNGASGPAHYLALHQTAIWFGDWNWPDWE